MKLTALLIAIEVGGTVAFAMSGLIEAMRKRMDVVGVFSVAFVTAFGGGTVRDLLLDRRPLFWVEHEAYLWLEFTMVITAPWWPWVSGPSWPAPSALPWPPAAACWPSPSTGSCRAGACRRNEKRR